MHPSKSAQTADSVIGCSCSEAASEILKAKRRYSPVQHLTLQGKTDAEELCIMRKVDNQYVSCKLTQLAAQFKSIGMAISISKRLSKKTQRSSVLVELLLLAMLMVPIPARAAMLIVTHGFDLNVNIGSNKEQPLIIVAPIPCK